MIIKTTGDFKLKTHKDLIAWQKSYALCLLVFQSTENFPRKEQFGLTSQIRRSILSVPSNIAEGYNRGSRPEYIRFLHIAYASLAEFETQILIAKDIRYIKSEEFTKIIDLQREVQRIILGLIKSLQ